MEQYNQTNPLIVIASLIVGVIIGYLIGTFTADTEMGTAVQDAGERAEQNLQEVDLSNNDMNNNDTATNSTGEASETAFVIEVDRLSSEQQIAIRAAGVGGEEIVITRGMVACAETEIGSERVVEIENGASISMSEGITLIACYNDN